MKIEKSVKDHELIQMEEIFTFMKEEEDYLKNKSNTNGKVNVHFIDPKDIKLEAKDLEGIKIIDNTSKKKEEKKEESKVMMLK